MQQKLYPNIRRLTTMFCVGIICVTLSMLAIRLVFSDMATVSAGDVSKPGGKTATETATTGEESAFPYQINSKIYLSSPESKGNLLIENFETNTHYMRVNITLDDTGRSVYYSGNIAPGTAIDSATLQEDLAEGTYACTATITAHDPATKAQIGLEEIPVTLYIGVRPEK